MDFTSDGRRDDDYERYPRCAGGGCGSFFLGSFLTLLLVAGGLVGGWYYLNKSGRLAPEPQTLAPEPKPVFEEVAEETPAPAKSTATKPRPVDVKKPTPVKKPTIPVLNSLSALPALLSNSEKCSLSVKPFSWKGLYFGESYLSIFPIPGGCRMTATSNLNGGRIELNPLIKNDDKGTRITLPDSIKILDKVNITQEMLDNWVVHCNPLLAKSRLKHGTISASLRNFSWRPDQAPEKGLATDVDVEIRDLEVTLAHEFDEMLAAAHLNDRVFKQQKLNIHATVSGGCVEFDKTTLLLDNRRVDVSGWTTFDGRLSCLVEVPLGEALFGQKSALGDGLSKLIGKQKIQLRVKGTVDNPTVELNGAKGLERLFR